MLCSSQLPLGARSFVRRWLRPPELPALGIVSADRCSPGVQLGTAGQSRRWERLLSPAALARDLAAAQRVYASRGGLPELFVFALNGAAVLELVEAAIGRVGGPKPLAHGQGSIYA